MRLASSRENGRVVIPRSQRMLAGVGFEKYTKVTRRTQFLRDGPGPCAFYLFVRSVHAACRRYS